MTNPTITIAGNLTRDPELRFTQAGHAIANFAVATNERRKNAQTGEWEDGDTSFWDCTAWRDAAELVAETLTKGAPVVVVGRARQRSYEAKDGSRRTAVDVDVDAVGIDLVVQARRAKRAGAPSSGGARPPASGTGWSGQQQQKPAATSDPWGTPTATVDEPPF